VESNPPKARIVPVRPAEKQADCCLVLGGRRIEVSQHQLLEPFAQLLESVEQVASVAGRAASASETKDHLRRAYRGLYEFFRALLPSASHEALDGLTYSVALLLVGEAIEAGGKVAAVRPRTAAEAVGSPSKPGGTPE